VFLRASCPTMFATLVGTVMGAHVGTFSGVEPSDVHPTVGPNGVLYAPTGGAYNASVVAINPDGSTKWKHKFDDVADSSFSLMNSVSPPGLSVDGTTVYITGTDGFLHALNAHDGTLKWSFECLENSYVDETCWMGDGVVCPLFQQVLVDEVGNVYFKGGQIVYALPASFGASSSVDDLSWKFNLGEHFIDDYFVSMHLELSDGALYIQSEHHFIALNASNGDALWFQSTSESGDAPRANGDAPRVAQDGRLYGYVHKYFEDGSDLVTVDESNVTVLRHFNESGQYRLATRDNNIFVSTDSSVHATHMDGTDKWVWTASDQMMPYSLSSPVICRDILYVGVGPSQFPGKGRLQALNVSTGTPLWSVSPNFTSIYYDCDSCGCVDVVDDLPQCCDFCSIGVGVTPSCSHDDEVVYFGVSTANRFLLTSAIARNGSILWAFSDWDVPITV